jgi:carbon monoxide dehydrogenase subunit G
MRLTATREINRPADEVFAFFSDASNNPKWQDGMVSCEWTTPSPIGVGSVYEQHARFMGRDVRSVFRVTEYEPGRSIKIETVESTFPITVHRTVHTTGPGTSRVDADIGGGPTGLLKLLAPLMRGRAQRSVDADYDRLKELLDSGGDV